MLLAKNIKHKSRYVRILALLTLCLSGNLFAQTPPPTFVPMLDTGAFNSCVVQDKNGFMWIATTDGLVRYDGYNKKRYNYYNGFPIKSNITTTVLVDRNNLVWFSIATKGLYSYDQTTKKVTHYDYNPTDKNTISSTLFNWVPRNLAEDKDGIIWVGTKHGLNSYDKRTRKFTRYTTNNSELCCDDILTVFVDRGDDIWVGTKDGLSRYDKKTRKFTTYKYDLDDPNSLVNNSVQAVAEDKRGDIWVGTKMGLSKLDKDKDKFVSHLKASIKPNSLNANNIFSLFVDKDNNLWICYPYTSTAGIQRYNIDKGKFHSYSKIQTDDGEIGEQYSIQSCFQDNQGILWLVDNMSKIYQLYLSPRGIRTYRHNPYVHSSLKCNIISTVVEDSDEALWIATERGINKFNDKTKLLEFPMTFKVGAKYLSTGEISTFFQDRQGLYWLGTFGGQLYCFDKDKNFVEQYTNDLLTGFTMVMIQDLNDKNIYWLGSEIDGFFKFNKKTGLFKQYKRDPKNTNSLSNNNVVSIFQDKNGILWVPTIFGLNRFDPASEQFKRYLHDPKDPNSISGNVVKECYVDSLGNFWVSTDDGGLNKFDEKREIFKRYGDESGFSAKTTMAILEDGNHRLWLSTVDSGIIVFDVIQDRVVETYDSSSDIQGNRFSLFVETACKRKNGELWFSGFDGVTRIVPGALLKKKLYKPPIYLTSLRCDGVLGDTKNKPVWQIKDIKLPWNKNSFEFEFITLDYSAPTKNQHAYMLEGFDKDWNYLGDIRFGKYTNVPPGKYTLHLKGSNSDGVWNEDGVSIKITVIPPFWHTWWFRIGGAAFALLLVSGFVKQKTRTIRRRARDLEEHNKELAEHIEERKRAENDAHEAREEVYQVELEAERDRAIASTTSIVAHDVRKPFTKLKSILDILPELKKDEIEKHSEDLDLSIRKVESMLSDIMEHSRDTRYVLVPENILPVLNMSIKDISRCYPKKKVNFHYHLETLNLIHLDEQRLSRAFDNIVSNAFDVMSDRGDFMWFITKGYGDHAEIIIGNSGTHIPEDQLDKIFSNKFTSCKKGGTGLGLGIVRKVVEGHEGSASARNVEKAPDFVPEKLGNGKGVEFVIILPTTNEWGTN